MKGVETNGSQGHKNAHGHAVNAGQPTGISQDERKKKCSKCGVEKLYSDFCNDKSRVDGKSYICKLCEHLKSKKYHDGNRGHY